MRVLLDEAGLKAFGTHTGSLGSDVRPGHRRVSANGLTQVRTLNPWLLDDRAGRQPESLATLADRVNANGTITAGWTEAARRSNVVGGFLAAQGIKYFYHPEQNWFQFFDAVAHPELKDVNRLEWFTENTDREKVFCEPDILHSYSGADRFPKSDGSRFDPFKWMLIGRQAVHRIPPQGRRPVPILGGAARGRAVHPEQVAAGNIDDRRDRVRRGRAAWAIRRRRVAGVPGFAK